MNNTFCIKCHRIPSQCCCLPVSKAIVTEKELNHMRSFFGCDPAYYGMTPAEPVAWMMVNRENTSAYLIFEKPTRDMKISHQPTPLYTHPVKELLITFDDCIAASLEQDVGYGGDLDLLEFARAILRKAQEK